LKQLINIALLAVVLFSCKPSNLDQKAQNEPESTENDLEFQAIASEFPATKLDELVESISQEELEKVINDGESEAWTRTVFDVTRGEISIRNKMAGDNTVKFVLYGHGTQWAMVGVQQQNAQVSTTKVWEYHYVVDGDHPERWNQHLLPEFKFDNFFDERVALPKEFAGQPAQSYLNYEMTPASISVSLNKWLFMRELESNSMEPEGPLDPALVKYIYVLSWNGDDFEERKVQEAGYSEILTFTTSVVDDPDYGPGPHEFDCPHGVTVKTSSVLPKQGAYSYAASNMLDDNDATSWAEGVKGDGVGEWIEFTITKDYRIGSSWQMGNGYTRNKDVWQANGRVKKMKVLIDDKVACYIMLSNIATYQSFSIAPYWLKDSAELKRGTKIKFVIEEVYKGSRYDDTVISYFVPTGNCG
jgi:hypothetical protein